jgi:hypothetical protein
MRAGTPRSIKDFSIALDEISVPGASAALPSVCLLSISGAKKIMAMPMCNGAGGS